MTSIGSPSPFFLAGKKEAYAVDRSLRFNYAEHLERTPSSTGNQKVWTFSAWIKRTEIGSKDYIYSASDSDYFALYFKDDNLYSYFDPNNNYGSVSDREFRDVGAWFHLVHQVDAVNTTQRIWINNQEMSLDSNRNPSNSNFPMNKSGVALTIGKASWKSEYNNMYLAEVHFSDGNKYAPTDFAETNAITGQWVPKSPSITYGTNGFYLNFSDNSGTTATTLGKDSSGNGNNFTPNNFSVAAGAGNDSVEDTPTINYCTLNPLDKNSSATASDGNLKATGGSAAHYPIFSTFGMKGGKWYAEFRNENNNNWRHSIMNIEHDGNSLSADSTVANNTSAVNKVGYGLNVSNGQKMHDSDSGSSYGSGLSGTSDVLQCAVDLDNGKIYWGINNTWFNSGDPAAGSNPAFSGIDTTITWTFAYHIYSSNGCTVNFGQQGFSYTPPSGFKALSSANLPDPTILLPNKHFDTKLYTGNGSSPRTISELQFPPDFVWLKDRSDSDWHRLQNSVIGANKLLYSNSSNAEATDESNGHLNSFTNDGFIVDDASGNAVNGNGSNYVTWNWNAGDTDGKTYTVTVVDDSGNKYRFDGFGTSAVTLDLAEGGTYIFNYPSAHPFRFSTTSDGTHGGGSEYTTGVTVISSTSVQIVVAASAPTLYYYCTQHSGMGGQINTNSTLGSSNFDGTVQATVKASPTTGFSIVSYTVPSGSGYSVGHGLNAVPQSILVKNRDTNSNWDVYSVHIGNTKRLKLNSTDAEETQPAFNNQTPTSTVFYGLGGGSWHGVGSKMINYVFSEVAGYNKFGKYEGNGNADGTFIFTGFRPAWVMIKMSSGSNSWVIYDNKRSPINLVDKRLRAQGNFSEDTHNGVDFLSNGFKTRNASSTSTNQNGSTYIYYAFAESPFKNARAR